MVRRGLALVALLASVACSKGSALPVVTTRLTQGGVTIELRTEVAATPEQRQTGLMNRRSLPAGTGMLFLFGEPSTGGFWMKNTLIPLDVAFVFQGKVTEIDSMVPCRADPCPLTAPPQPYFSAIEANRGAFGAISAGAEVAFLGQLPSPS